MLRSPPLNHKGWVLMTKRHKAVLELTLMGTPLPILVPQMDPEEAPLINLVSPPSPRGFFPHCQSHRGIAGCSTGRCVYPSAANSSMVAWSGSMTHQYPLGSVRFRFTTLSSFLQTLRR